jgi:3-hydroxybutyryl-CoA dehydrogenase
MGSTPKTVGVLGAGTMGAGIAEVAEAAGMRVLRRDPALGLEDDLSPCDLVIEAAPERLALKRELVAELEAVLRPDAVIASNTSSIAITAIAAQAEHPERVVGMHFFNPPARMRLVEIVAGLRSGTEALAAARAAAEAMGKQAIDVPDTPGFLVNRCNRPFGLEALRIVGEGLATPEQVDRIVRLAGGYRMGPFELMDLVGLDTTFDVQLSFWEQSFGEPRWRPSAAVQRMVAAGRLGRKSGEGWFRYPRERGRDGEPPAAGGGDGLIVVAGESALAADLLEAAAEAGWDAATPEEAQGEVPALIVDCGASEDDPPLQGGPQAILVDAAPQAAIDPHGTAAGFFTIAPFAEARLVELTRSPTTSAATASATERFFSSLGRTVEWVGDAPGLVLGRLLACLVNEGCFAVGEGVGTAEDVDAGLVLGLNHPRGPLEWADLHGPAEVLTIVEGLYAQYREERYRPAPALLRAVRAEQPLRPAL